MAKNQCWDRNVKKEDMLRFPEVPRDQAPSAHATGALQTVQGLYSLYTRAAAIAREKEVEKMESAPPSPGSAEKGWSILEEFCTESGKRRASFLGCCVHSRGFARLRSRKVETCNWSYDSIMLGEGRQIPRWMDS
jgi:hypothetical protein